MDSIKLEKLQSYMNTSDKLSAAFLNVFWGLLLTVIGVYVGITFLAPQIMALGLWSIAFMMGSFFLMLFVQNHLTYSLFTFVNGLFIMPVISSYISAGMTDVILQALIATGVMTLGLTIYAKTSKTDFLKFAGIAFWVIMAIFIVGLLNVFLFKSGVVALGLSVVTVLAFSLYLIIDVQMILKTNVTPLSAAISLYLNIINIFLSLLRILREFR